MERRVSGEDGQMGDRLSRQTDSVSGRMGMGEWVVRQCE